MQLNFSSSTKKEELFKQIKIELIINKLNINSVDQKRPWGGFFTIEEKDSERFIDFFFQDFKKEILKTSEKLSPKILVVAPGKRLSWQYHHRRAEIWKLIAGKGYVITSDTDEEKKKLALNLCEIVQIKQGERHRLIGLDNWGIIAEIWQHTDVESPSDENDIVRLQDDFGR